MNSPKHIKQGTAQIKKSALYLVIFFPDEKLLRMGFGEGTFREKFLPRENFNQSKGFSVGYRRDLGWL